MPVQSVLDMTQEILSALSSDEVNSIGDTVESMQVATCIKRAYLDIVSRSSLPEHDQIIQLDPSLDVTRPVLMYVPYEVNKIEWLKYFDSNVLDGTTPNTFQHDLNVNIVRTTTGATTGTPPGFLNVEILPTKDFIDRMVILNPRDTNVKSFTFTDTANGFPVSVIFYYKNNKQPQYCTVIGNNYVIFDSYDVTQDDTLQTSKTLCWGRVSPVFKMTDNFIPRLDDKQFPLLLNEAKALAFLELKQQPHPKAEQEIKRQWSSVQKNKSVDNKPTYFEQLPNFGRQRGMRYGPILKSW